MTPEEREQLEKEYPMIDFGRLGYALLACAIIVILGVIFI